MGTTVQLDQLTCIKDVFTCALKQIGEALEEVLLAFQRNQPIQFRNFIETL